MDKEDTNNHHHHHHHHRHDHGQRPTHLLLCLTGSVATIKAVPLIQQLRQKFQSKLEIKIVVTDAATKFVDVEVLKKEFGIEVYSDEMEWMSWKRNDPVLHIELRTWADLILVAPLSANTLAKFASGICDNLLTCLVRATPTTPFQLPSTTNSSSSIPPHLFTPPNPLPDYLVSKTIILAPAMNTAMWYHPITYSQIKYLIDDLNMSFIWPTEKVLACGDKGIGAMAEVDHIVDIVGKHV